MRGKKNNRSAAKPVVVVPHDSTDFAEGVCDWLHVGGAGVVAVVPAGASAAVNMTCVAGQRLDVRAKRINATNTTATLIVAMYD